MDKMLKEFSESLHKDLGSNLKSFIVYGSAATGELYKTSDYNTLIIVENFGSECLKKMEKSVKKWCKRGQPVPLIFDRHSIIKSNDVFPIEFLDIKENHFVAVGKDFFKNMKIDSKNLRLEIERELKSNIIRLRQSFIVTGGNPKKVKELMRGSISTFSAIFKGILRYLKLKAPQKKAEIITALSEKISLNTNVFFDILALKDGVDRIKNNEIDDIFNFYINDIEKVADFLDKHKKAK